MKRKRQYGFTIMELTIATFTGAIVIVAAGMILFFGQRTWNRSWDRTNLQRDASYAMLRMTKDVKAGTSAQVENSGSGLRILNGGDWVRYYTASGGSTLAIMRETGGANYQTVGSETIVEDSVEALLFSVTGNTVTIDFKMNEYNMVSHFNTTVMMRNYGQ